MDQNKPMRPAQAPEKVTEKVPGIFFSLPARRARLSRKATRH